LDRITEKGGKSARSMWLKDKEGGTRPGAWPVTVGGGSRHLNKEKKLRRVRLAKRGGGSFVGKKKRKRERRI